MFSDVSLDQWFGPKSDERDLSIPKVQEIVEFINLSRTESVFQLVEIRRENDCNGLTETIVVDAFPELPQIREEDIRNTERLAITFEESDTQYPQVQSLRPDFPNIVHVNPRRVKDLPASLCIYYEPYAEVKLSWSPRSFLFRIIDWLGRAATGQLHLENQGLEPLIFGTNLYMVLPAGLENQVERNVVFDFRLVRIPGGDGKTVTLKPVSKESDEGKTRDPSLAVVFKANASVHGFIEAWPTNLDELQEITVPLGLDIVGELTQRIVQKEIDLSTLPSKDSNILLVIIFPKVREEGGQIEESETWAFRLDMSPQELAIKIGISGKDPESGQFVPLIGTTNSATIGAKLKDVPLLPIRVIESLSPAKAAELNGDQESSAKVVCIGAGSIRFPSFRQSGSIWIRKMDYYRF